MGEISWPTVLAFLGILGAMAGMLKYTGYMLDKNQKHIDQRFDDIETAQANNAKGVDTLRQEVYKEFVRREDHQGLAKAIRADSQVIFKKLDGVSKAVNQLIGKVNGSVDAK